MHPFDAREVTHLTAPEERLKELNDKAKEISSTAGLLGTPVPAFSIEKLGAHTNNAAVIRFSPKRKAKAGLAAVADGALADRAGELVKAIAPALGLATTQTAEFEPNLSVTDVAGAVRVVRIAQHYRGIPIFHATSALHFDTDDEPARMLGAMFTVTGDPTTEPTVTAAGAVLAAATFVNASPEEAETDQFGRAVPFTPVDLTGFEPRLVAEGTAADRPSAFDGAPFATPIRARLIWFPRSSDDLSLAWQVEISFSSGASSFRVLVDAQSAEVLYARQLVQGLQATFPVFTMDGAGSPETVTVPLPWTAYGDLVTDLTIKRPPRDWVDDGHATTGNSTLCVRGGGDESLRGAIADGQVSFDPQSDQEQWLLNAFYHASRLHDLFYLLGFREKDWNFQVDNGRLGGTGGDPVRVEVHPGEVDMVANMLTRAEGESPVLQLGTFVVATEAGEEVRHSALDATVVTHEFTHGVTNRLVGGPSDVEALGDKQSAGLGEGLSDYVACTTLGTTTIGSWLTNLPGGIRSHPYDEDYPADAKNFGRIGKSGCRGVHEVGQVWAATLMEMNRRIGDKLGLQLVAHALKLSPSNPSFLDMRDAILSAVDVLAATGDLAEDKLASTKDGLWAVFAKFGMGPAASCDDATFGHVVADFETPPPGATKPRLKPQGPGTLTLGTDPDQPLAITPDTPDVDSTLTVSDNRQVTGIKVTVDLDHPSPEQLRVSLRSPGGRVILHNGPSAGHELAATYTSDEVPELAGLLGQPAAGDWSLLVVDLSGTASGTLRSWGLGLAVGLDPGVAHANPGVAIPDNFATGVLSPLELEADGAAGHIIVDLRVTHPQPADLLIELVAPSGRTAILRGLNDDAGGAHQTYDSGSSQRLAELHGQAITGVWTLRVSDHVPGDVGRLERWRLTVRPG